MGVLIRIVLRYVAGLLIAWGLISEEDTRLVLTDPHLIGWLEVGFGLAAGFVAESWYRIAKRMGWKT